MAGATALTIDEWESGNLSTTGSEQWFSFTATATTHHVHFKEGTLSSVYVQLHDSIGNLIESRKSLYGTPDSVQYATLTNGETYYIKVTPRYSSSTGTYQIGFTESSSSPDIIAGIADATPLTADTWANGEITTTTKEQWYKFDATADTQYVHFKEGTLSSVDMTLYTGSAEKLQLERLSSTNPYSDSFVTPGQTYYIRITPYYSSRTGTYQIVFSDSSVTPAE